MRCRPKPLQVPAVSYEITVARSRASAQSLEEVAIETGLNDAAERNIHGQRAPAGRAAVHCRRVLWAGKMVPEGRSLSRPSGGHQHGARTRGCALSPGQHRRCEVRAWRALEAA